jgi:hypothetical protein
MSKPAMAGPWLQATSLSGVPAVGPCQPGKVLCLFQNPLDAAVQAQDQVRCHPRVKCQQHYREKQPWWPARKPFPATEEMRRAGPP